MIKVLLNSMISEEKNTPIIHSFIGLVFWLLIRLRQST